MSSEQMLIMGGALIALFIIYKIEQGAISAGAAVATTIAGGITGVGNTLASVGTAATNSLYDILNPTYPAPGANPGTTGSAATLPSYSSATQSVIAPAASSAVDFWTYLP